MVMKLGMIGMSDGNGHPYSYSAIFNGFDANELIRSGWFAIYAYLIKRDVSDFGIQDARITHAWTQNRAMTVQLCKTCHIPVVVNDIYDMIGEVDAVIIARDDASSHAPLALPFLEHGIPVFIDKPLALDIASLRQLKPYLERGLLMSCSAMRFASELDYIRSHLSTYGRLLLIQGIHVNDWEKYGIHLLDAVFSVVQERPISVTAIGGRLPTYVIVMSDGSIFQMNPLETDAPTVLNVRFVGTKRMSSYDIADNFTMFRRMLSHFIELVKTGIPSIDPSSTLDTMKVLISGNQSVALEKEVRLDEIEL